MIKISDSIKYTGVNDYDVDLFEGQYILENGMAYNSYVILDEKTALLDTADKIAVDRWLENVDEVLGDVVPDYLIVHHLEPDHSFGIQAACDKFPNMQLVMSANAKRMLPQFVDVDLDRVVTVAEGDKLELGAHTLNFVAAPMVHWPEVLVSYESSEKVLSRLTHSESSAQPTPTRAGVVKQEDIISTLSASSAHRFSRFSKKPQDLILRQFVRFTVLFLPTQFPRF